MGAARDDHYYNNYFRRDYDRYGWNSSHIIRIVDHELMYKLIVSVFGDLILKLSEVRNGYEKCLQQLNEIVQVLLSRLKGLGNVDWITESKAQQLFGIHRGTFGRAAKRGEIITHGKSGRSTRLDIVSVTQYVIQHSDPFEPRLSKKQVRERAEKLKRERKR
jgi:hypothetical protein